MLFRQVGKFIIVGGVSALIDFVVYTFLVGTLSTPVPLSKSISFIAGAIFGFITNRNWTFQSRTSVLRGSLLFSLVYLASFFTNVAANSGVLWLLQNQTPVAFFVAFGFATALSAMLNFLGMKFLVFRQSSEGTTDGM